MGCGARLALVAVPVFYADINPPSTELASTGGAAKCVVRCEHHEYFHDPYPLFLLCCIPNDRVPKNHDTRSLRDKQLDQGIGDTFVLGVNKSAVLSCNVNSAPRARWYGGIAW